MRWSQVLVSQCTRPDAGRDVTLPLFARWGFDKVEAFATWAGSRLDWHDDPAALREEAERHGLRYLTYHLPALDEPGRTEDEALRDVLDAIDFAREVGVGKVYLRSQTFDGYARHGRRLAETAVAAGMVPLVEPHDHTPTPDTRQTRRVLDAIGHDAVRAVLELGHLDRAGDPWEQFLDAMGGFESRGGLVVGVHLKNTRDGGGWERWREGRLDLPAILDRCDADGFDGDLVIETTLGDPAVTEADLLDLRDYLRDRLDG